MIPGLYTAASALTQRFRAQEIIASNLAGSSTLGFHRQTTPFEGFGVELYNAQSAQTNSPRTVSGVALRENIWDFQAGALKETSNPLDFAVQGNGFFVLQTPNGERLTKAGAFMKNSKNELVMPNGDHVMGSRGVITLPDGQISTKTDGTICVDGKDIDKLRVVAPKDVRNLDTVGGGLFKVINNDTAANLDKPEVLNGYLQQSNVSTPEEMVSMLENNRMAESLGKAMQMLDETLGRANQDLAG